MLPKRQYKFERAWQRIIDEGIEKSGYVVNYMSFSNNLLPYVTNETPCAEENFPNHIINLLVSDKGLWWDRRLEILQRHCHRLWIHYNFRIVIQPDFSRSMYNTIHTERQRVMKWTSIVSSSIGRSRWLQYYCFPCYAIGRWAIHSMWHSRGRYNVQGELQSTKHSCDPFRLNEALWQFRQLCFNYERQGNKFNFLVP